jgi:hypothetical protein
MKTSRVREAINALKAGTDDSSVSEKRVPKPEPKKTKKVLVKAEQVRKG